jgi:hypothetical protein
LDNYYTRHVRDGGVIIATTLKLKITRGDSMEGLPEWAEGFDPESVKRAVDAGDILPRLPLPHTL